MNLISEFVLEAYCFMSPETKLFGPQHNSKTKLCHGICQCKNERKNG